MYGGTDGVADEGPAVVPARNLLCAGAASNLAPPARPRERRGWIAEAFALGAAVHLDAGA
ncbi:hypothetical protein FHX82_003826 [Amycolatopsis bartoniae]|uniref:Uncharacterized protein n=1 Tax=Amycolatopsis bartoniae TaxID=941986 RepID=A0A8H9MC02_9PSEU|nr:hypothetical protein [Amycolatopsis bartoniae]GHF49947.1 hypothetical protein GCM10017566_23760 [Amycolatopsis bartoniae]